MSLVPPTPGRTGTRTAMGELRLGAVLIGLAGAVDAIGFLKIGGLFLSFMSGDSTQAAAALVLHEDARLAIALALVGLFVTGAFLGGIVGWASGERSQRAVLLATLTGLLGSGWFIAHQGRLGFGISLTVLAMGLQNAISQRAGGTVVGATYATGTLARLGEGLAKAATRQAGTEAWAPYLLLWLALIAGAATGAAIYARYGVDALLAPVLVAGLLAVREVSQGASHPVLPGAGPPSAGLPDPGPSGAGPWKRKP